MTTEKSSYDDASSPREAVVKALGYVYGPCLVALFFASSIRGDPSLEVMLASSVNFADRANVGMGWMEFYSTIALRLICIAAVPASVYAASRMTVASTQEQVRGSGEVIARIMSSIAFAAYCLALVSALDLPNRCEVPALGWEPGAGPSLVLTCGRAIFTIVGTTLFFGAACFALAALFTRIIATVRSAFLGWGFVALICALTAVGVLAPEWARLIGPLGTSGVFFSILAFGLACLTVISTRHLPDWMLGFPLVLLLVMLWILTDRADTGATVVLVLALAGLVGAFTRGVRTCMEQTGQSASPESMSWRCFLGGFGAMFTAPFGLVGRLLTRRLFPLERAGLALAALASAIWVLHWIYTDCDSLSGCNRLPGVPFTQMDPEEIPASSADAFKVWSGRDNRRITVVAAQGGGLFAAYHAAYYLAARADADPAFRSQLFAVSGVSGGAVGGGVYWAIRKSGICDRPGASPDCHRRAVDAILQRDFLSPLLARFFTIDIVDAIIPITPFVSQPIERGVVLEQQINESVNEWLAATEGAQPVPRDLLLGSLAESWTGQGDLPLLFLNATDVISGDLIVMSPVQRIRRSVPGMEETRPARLILANGNDFSIVNAMVSSARFLLVTPAARVLTLIDGEPVRLQLADGGVFDVSGLETGREIVRDLSAVHTGEIELIMFDVPWLEIDRSQLASYLGSPLVSFVGAWRARRQLLLDRIREEAALGLGGTEARIDFCRMRVRVSNDVAQDFTISWFLARSTFDLIRQQIDGTETAPVVNQGLTCG